MKSGSEEVFDQALCSSPAQVSTTNVLPNHPQLGVCAVELSCLQLSYAPLVLRAWLPRSSASTLRWKVSNSFPWFVRDRAGGVPSAKKTCLEKGEPICPLGHISHVLQTHKTHKTHTHGGVQALLAHEVAASTRVYGGLVRFVCSRSCRVRDKRGLSCWDRRGVFCAGLLVYMMYRSPRTCRLSFGEQAEIALIRVFVSSTTPGKNNISIENVSIPRVESKHCNASGVDKRSLKTPQQMEYLFFLDCCAECTDASCTMFRVPTSIGSLPRILRV